MLCTDPKMINSDLLLSRGWLAISLGWVDICKGINIVNIQNYSLICLTVLNDLPPPESQNFWATRPRFSLKGWQPRLRVHLDTRDLARSSPGSQRTKCRPGSTRPTGTHRFCCAKWNQAAQQARCASC